MSIFWNYEKFASKKIVSSISLVAIVACCVAKLFLCSVSIDGGSIYYLMTADYWNIGKDILNGSIVYSDVVDHKGLYLYLLYTMLVWLSKNHIAILTIAETTVYVATIGAFYRYVVRNCTSEDSDRHKVALLPTSLFAIMYALATSGATLVNTEGLVVIAGTMVLDYIQNLQKIKTRDFAIIGLVLGVFFNFKVTSIVLFAPMYLYVCAKHIRNKGMAKDVVVSTIAGAISFVIANIPFVAYLISNDVLENFVHIYQCVLSGGNSVDISKVVLSIGVVILSIVLCIKKMDNIASTLMILSTIMLYSIFGGASSYYTAVICGMVMFTIFQKNRVNIVVMIAIAFVMGKDVVKTHTDYEHDKGIIDKVSQQSISEKYGIDNSNILYIWEDFGYGAYSNQAYVESFQWLPIKMLFNEEFQKYYVELTNQRLETKQFKYVLAIPPTKFEEIREKDKDNYLEEPVLRQIEKALMKNYEPSEEYTCLYIAK